MDPLLSSLTLMQQALFKCETPRLKNSRTFLAIKHYQGVIKGLRSWLKKLAHICVGPQIGMNPKLILGLPDLETVSECPRSDMGIAFLVIFSVTHKIGLFSPKIEAILIAHNCL